MAMRSYKITICEVLPDVEALRSGKSASQVDTLGVQADGIDPARLAARKALRDRGYVVRSVNFTSPTEMVAYVVKPAATAVAAPRKR
jgi:hypothetical protein